MERPAELAYALDERPPWTHLVGLGFQHVAVMSPYFVIGRARRRGGEIAA